MVRNEPSSRSDGCIYNPVTRLPPAGNRLTATFSIQVLSAALRRVLTEECDSRRTPSAAPRVFWGPAGDGLTDALNATGVDPRPGKGWWRHRGLDNNPFGPPRDADWRGAARHSQRRFGGPRFLGEHVEAADGFEK